ncbi:MAG: hypothetical protein WCA39_11595, partial [Nitrososphaeraceae archaeon]
VDKEQSHFSNYHNPRHLLRNNNNNNKISLNELDQTPDLGLRIPGWLQNASDVIAAILGRCTTVSSFVTISPSSISAMPAMDLHVVEDTWPVFSTTSYSIMPTRDHI